MSSEDELCRQIVFLRAELTASRAETVEAKAEAAEAKATAEQLRKLLCPPELSLFFIERFGLTKTFAEIAAVLTTYRGVCAVDYICDCIYLPREAPAVFGSYIHTIRNGLTRPDVDFVVNIETIPGKGYEMDAASQLHLLQEYSNWGSSKLIIAELSPPLTLSVDEVCPPGLRNMLIDQFGCPAKPAALIAMIVAAERICRRETVKSALSVLYKGERLYADEDNSNRQMLYIARRVLRQIDNGIEIKSTTRIGYRMSDDDKRKVTGAMSEESKQQLPAAVKMRLALD